MKPAAYREDEGGTSALPRFSRWLPKRIVMVHRREESLLYRLLSTALLVLLLAATLQNAPPLEILDELLRQVRSDLLGRLWSALPF